MSDAALAHRSGRPPRSLTQAGVLAILALGAALYWLREDLPWALAWPDAWVLPLKNWVGAFTKWLINDLDFGVFTFKEFTRAIAAVLEVPYDLVRGLLSKGFVLRFGETVLSIPPISWLVLLGLATWAGWRLKDRGLALLVFCCLGYLALFGRWEGAMITLSSIVVAVPLGVTGGLAIGVLGHRSPRVERAITPLLDFMQTVPIFAYLVPMLFLFGFGPVAAMVATMIYAMPPMVRVTLLALKQVPPEVVEFGRMAGCTRRQMNWKVLVPAAAPSLMVGVNQVIMLSLNMVIIAAMIGAGGLGHEVLTAMRALKFGAGIEASLAIAFLAIAVDRLSQAYATRKAPALAIHEGLWRRHRALWVGLLAIMLVMLLGWLWGPLQSYPDDWQITAGSWTDRQITALNKAWFDELEGVKNFLLLNLMIPFKRFLSEDLPWPAAVLLLAFLGWRLGGWRLAAIVAALLGFLVVTGLWQLAMISVYLVGTGVLFACLIGIPLGVLAAKSRAADRVIQPVIDTLQTLPAFAYLMPAVVLFRVGDFTALIAVVAYAVVAPVRYTAHGLKQVSPALVEAAITSGCTPRQRLFKVELPLALPQILLGVNQCIMLALSMLVITALVGTRDLGQEVYIALTKADPGRGLVAGAGVACIAIVADRLMQAWARERSRRLGLAS
jgi:glycine betaine/proline transport system permease protein